MIGALLRWMGYSVYFTVALVAFLYLSIPTSKVKRFVAHKATKALKKKVTIGELEIRGISGVTLTNVVVELPLPEGQVDEAASAAGAPAAEATPGAADDDEDEPTKLFNPPGLLMADKLALDVNTWDLLTGKPLKALLNADISGGTLTDVAFEARGGKKWTLEVGDMTGIDLGPMRLLRTMAKMEMDLMARLSGRMHVEWNGKLGESTADIELQLSDTLIPYLPIKHPKEPFPIGEAFQVAIGDVELNMKLDKAENLPSLGTRTRGISPKTTTLFIEKLRARGEHVDIQLDSGQKHTIAFRGPKTSDGYIDVKLVVHFTDEFFAWKGDGVRSDGYEAKDVSHQALKPAMNSFLRTARVRIGGKYYYGFHCQGTLKNFKCPPRAPSRRLTTTVPTPPAAQSAVPKPTARPKPSTFERPRPTPRPTTTRSTEPRRPAQPRGRRATTTSRSPASRLVEPARDRERANAEARRGLRPNIPEAEPPPEPPPVDEPPPEELLEEEPLEDEEPRIDEEPLDDELLDEDLDPEDELDEPGDEELDEELDELDEY